jgi:hypothetical protein
MIPPEKLRPHADIEAYLMDPDQFADQWGNMLAPFSPPLPREGMVILASYFGDVWVQETDGAVWWLNGLEERVDRFAMGQDQTVERVWENNLVTLKTKLMEQLVKADMLLPVGMVYGLKVPRAEGGKYHPDNIGTAPIAEAFAYMGARFKAKGPAPKGPVAAPAKPKNGLWGKKS